MNIGRVIKTRRGALRLTLLDVSTRTGLTVSFLCDIEHDRSAPSLDSLQAIASALETRASVLISATERKTRRIASNT